MIQLEKGVVGVGGNSRVGHNRTKVEKSEIDDSEIGDGEVNNKVGKKGQKIFMSKNSSKSKKLSKFKKTLGLDFPLLNQSASYNWLNWSQSM